MSVIVPHRAIAAVAKSSDPKKAIMDQIGPKLDQVHVLFNMVVVGIYIRPEKTAGGIIRPDMNVQEDVWQGKVGLVLKHGPFAFEDDGDSQFFGQKVDIGEWGVFKVGDGWPLEINGYPCRVVRDSSFRLKIDDPSIVL